MKPAAGVTFFAAGVTLLAEGVTVLTAGVTGRDSNKMFQPCEHQYF